MFYIFHKLLNNDYSLESSALEHSTRSSFYKSASKSPQTALRAKPSHMTHTSFMHLTTPLSSLNAGLRHIGTAEHLF